MNTAGFPIICNIKKRCINFVDNKVQINGCNFYPFEVLFYSAVLLWLPDPVSFLYQEQYHRQAISTIS
jgi:hypothetical protein